MFENLRLGRQRRALLREGLRGPVRVLSGDNRSQQSARQRAASALIKAGLAERCWVMAPGRRGWLEQRKAIRLTASGKAVVQAFAPELRNRHRIKWRRFDKLAALFSPEARSRAQGMLEGLGIP